MKSITRISAIGLAVACLATYGIASAEDKVLPGYIDSARKAWNGEEAKESRQLVGEVSDLAFNYGKKAFLEIQLHQIDLAQASAASQATATAYVGVNLAVDGMFAFGLLRAAQAVPVVRGFASGYIGKALFYGAAGIVVYMRAEGKKGLVYMSPEHAVALKTHVQEQIARTQAEIDAATN